MIIFDLEWNSGLYERLRLDEILEIGAVKTSRLGGPIEDTFQSFIKPSLHKRYSPGAAELPALALCEASELDFPAALARFAAWCGDERDFATWGAGDFGVLRQNLRYWKLDFPIPETYLDLQAAFRDTVGAQNSVALHCAVEYCQLPDLLDFHSSLHDALYTALVAQWLDPAQVPACRRESARSGQPKEKPTDGLPKLGRRWQGPFQDLDQLLSNRGCRRGDCPVCGGKSRVTYWRCGHGGPYLSKFRCPEHGTFLLRLDTGRDKQGRLWGAPQTVTFTPENQLLWADARKGEQIFCAGKRAARRRRKR